ncbi:Sulfoquinovose 1-dehydrogenase [Paraburkholderia nemoris]|uniref:Sulfoquinovose 1-dehydrogenase n=1 Tax=Paraburkholderia nemoris TaxID=2793076 RepID=A0ABN7LUT7_9BURK|nr:SDR family NAD(P)-dependent oxidoreductase [Paraburkholderia nemoris]MBK3811893.1 SDR family NAD(P)-dependent oxidoreductase [Paraburkholderia aspalathi]MBK5146595.1 SDR family NAD(P)-dependent oxidoreductase [Burkholderia sp. R-69608]CAE6770533.1 Sulfoquinovose 1-dehydrogenase [Paraburkholderia nemoris]CAE6860449.1 Sulfoquinovose 1-dehydrogenase [Paraburkholderia nemoris]
MSRTETVLIVGAGKGLSASLARLFAAEGMQVALAARDTSKLTELVDETGALPVRCDASQPDDVSALFDRVEDAFGAPDLVVYNASGRYRAAVEDIDPEKLEEALKITAVGGFLVAQAAAVRMLARGSGTILLTGATASVKGLPGSTPFAMGKFALRGMAQSMARELAPKNIHVAHFIIDGGIASSRPEADVASHEDKWLDPDAIAKEYLHIHRQHRSAWTWEVELRPWVEKF